MSNRAQFPWPDHWYADQHRHNLLCIVPDCDFSTDLTHVGDQWEQLHYHSRASPGSEHALLEIMLRQCRCAHCDWPATKGQQHYRLRVLYDHEKNHHESAQMFHTDSFVVLARQRRILLSNGFAPMRRDQYCESFILSRMIDNAQDLPPADLDLIYQKGGFTAGEHTIANLRGILTRDPLADPGDDSPLLPNRFLSFCRPHDTDPADAEWRRVWQNIVDMYTDGRI